MSFLKILSKSGGWLVLLVLLLAAFLSLEHFPALQPVVDFLNSERLSFSIGESFISPYVLLKAVLIVVVLFWVVGVVCGLGEAYIGAMDAIRPSNRALLVKSLQILVYFIGFVVGLDVLEIDLTSFAILSGAIGIGIGFGLQKITSNFISGLILLFEKSIEKDDLIELADGTLGFVRYTGARYTLVETFDGKEIMVPNDDFITNQVTNWSFSNSKGRVDINVGVGYESDLEKVMELLLQAAKEHPCCIDDPEPTCFLLEFADSSVNFALYFWVADVANGRLEPQSTVMLSIWKKFKEHGIVIPYPQRDVHVKNPGSLK